VAAGEALFPAEVVAPDDGMTKIDLCGERLRLDPSGALWWPAARTLVVADMHLEKGSAYAAMGQMLPPYDSAATLARLARLVGKLRPKRLIALGDSFHDVRAGERMDETTAAALMALAAAHDMVWIAGNHDPEVPGWLPGRRLPELVEGPLAFRHEPHPDASPGEIAGHLHPVAKVVGEKGRVRRRAFVTDGARLLLPAFGAYAGGLNLRDTAIADLFAPGRIVAHVCGATRVYPVGGRRLAGD
jgi:DNA ligase-associated metallophosphoesterase